MGIFNGRAGALAIVLGAAVALGGCGGPRGSLTETTGGGGPSTTQYLSHRISCYGMETGIGVAAGAILVGGAVALASPGHGAYIAAGALAGGMAGGAAGNIYAGNAAQQAPQMGKCVPLEERNGAKYMAEVVPLGTAGARTFAEFPGIAFLPKGKPVVPISVLPAPMAAGGKPHVIMAPPAASAPARVRARARATVAAAAPSVSPAEVVDPVARRLAREALNAARRSAAVAPAAPVADAPVVVVTPPLALPPAVPLQPAAAAEQPVPLPDQKKIQ